jgi:DNA-binding transcriptional LysR family regulator
VHDERLVARPLGAFQRVLVASAAYLDGRVLKSVDDLRSCNCLGFELDGDHTVWSLERTSERPRRTAPEGQQVEVRGNFAAKSFTAMVGAVGAGLGIAQMPEFLIRPHLARRSLVRVLPEWASPPIPVLLVHRFGHERIARVRAVLDAALRRIPTLLRDPARNAPLRSR